MRKTILRFIILAGVGGFNAKATLIQGGPCIEASLQDYFGLGLAGCQVSIAGYHLTVNLEGSGSGTNGPTYPNDWSQILLNPSFTPLAGGGYEEQFGVTLAPGSWSGLPGQSLFFMVSLGITLDRPITSLTHTVYAQNGDITAEICPSGIYVFATLCAFDNEYQKTASGTSATVSLGAPASLTTYGVLASFSGYLPDGQFYGITSVADVDTAPEPAAWVLVLGSFGVLLGNRRMQPEHRIARPGRR